MFRSLTKACLGEGSLSVKSHKRTVLESTALDFCFSFLLPSIHAHAHTRTHSQLITNSVAQIHQQNSYSDSSVVQFTWPEEHRQIFLKLSSNSSLLSGPAPTAGCVSGRILASTHIPKRIWSESLTQFSVSFPYSL